MLIILEHNNHFSRLEAREPATKGDVRESELELQKEITNLELKIEQAKNQLILWGASMFIASGFIQHFFK